MEIKRIPPKQPTRQDEIKAILKVNGKPATVAQLSEQVELIKEYLGIKEG
jgi:hypothetical protein